MQNIIVLKITFSIGTSSGKAIHSKCYIKHNIGNSMRVSKIRGKIELWLVII